MPRMLPLLFVALAFLLIAANSKRPVSENDQMVKIVSANLHAAAGIDPMPASGISADRVISNLKVAAAIFKTAKADVILLQEVDQGSARTGHINQAQWLAENLGMHMARAITLDTRRYGAPLPEVLRDCQYGLALLSRWPIVSQHVVMLPNPPEDPSWPVNEGRALLWADLKLPSGETLRAGVIHLDYRQNGVRSQQLSKALNEMGGNSWVIGGDFNQPLGNATTALPDDLSRIHNWEKKPVWPFQDALPLTKFHRELAPTYPLPDPIVAIDAIFTGGAAQLEALDRLDSGGSSDHQFVAATVRPSR